MKKSTSHQHRTRSNSIKRVKRHRRLPIMESLERRAMLAGDVAPLHNEAFPTDINGDGKVTQLDVDVMMSEMKAQHISASAQSGLSLEGEQSLYLDVNNDGKLTNSDLLSVLDSLALEGEQATANFKVNYDLELIGNNGTKYEGNTADPATVNVGESFTLNVYVQDLSTDANGVPLPNGAGLTQAFVDITMTNGTTNLLDSSKFLIEDASTDITLGSLWSNPTANIPANVTPWGARIPANSGPNNLFIEDGKLKWIGGFNTTLGNGARTEDPLLLASIKFTATDTTDINGINFNVNVQPLPNRTDPNDVVVAYNTQLRDGTSNQSGTNLNATLLEDANPTGSTADVVRFDGGTVNLVVNPAVPNDGANDDFYTVNQNYGTDDVNSDPPVVEINNIKYYVLDVLANDLDGAGNSVPSDYFTIDPNSLTTPSQGTVQVLHRTDPQNDEVSATGIQSTDVILYQVPTDVANVSTTFDYTLVDNASPTTPVAVDTAKVTININSVIFSPVAQPITILVDSTDPNPVSDNVLNYVTDGDNTPDELTIEFLMSDGNGGYVPLDPNTLQGTFIPETDINGDYTGAFTYQSNVPGLMEMVYYQVTDPNDNTSGPTEIFLNTLVDTLVQGVVYFDVNNNGTWDENLDNDGTPENFIGGVLIQLIDGNGSPVISPHDGLPYQVRTDAHGAFSFTGIDTGSYGVKIVDPKYLIKGITSVGNLTVNQAGDVVTGINLTDQDGQTAVMQFGFVGRDFAYIGPGDRVASNTNNDIVLAFSKSNGVATLEWYSADEGWDRLAQIPQDFAYYDIANHSMQIAFELTVAGQSDLAIVPQAFSTSQPAVMILAETDDAVIIRIEGTQEDVLTNLAAVDAAFAGN